MSNILIASTSETFLDVDNVHTFDIPQIERPDGSQGSRHPHLCFVVPYAAGSMINAGGITNDWLRYAFDRTATADDSMYEATWQRPIAIPAGAKQVSVYCTDPTGLTIVAAFGEAF